MLIRLDVQRIVRKLKDVKKKRWYLAAYNAILAELYALEASVRSQRFDHLHLYPVFCEVALIYAKETIDSGERRKLRELVKQAIEVLKWLERVTIDRKNAAKIRPVLSRVEEILGEFNALPK